MTVRRIYNPVQQDAVTFLQTAAETLGEFSLVEVELAPGGGNPLHYHIEFTERFEVLSGELRLQVGSKEVVLKPGDYALAEIKIPHRFFNVSAEPARFRVEVRPAHPGFEQSLRIAYGLAGEGAMVSRYVPKSPLAMAYVVTIGDTHLPGMLRFINPLVRLLAQIAVWRGLKQRLTEKYLQPF